MQSWIAVAACVFLVTECRLAAAEADDALPARPRVNTAAAMLGVRPYRPGRWGIVAVRVSNPTDRDATILVSSSVKSFPYDRYARTYWVPANGIRHGWQHIFFPNNLPENAATANIESTAADVTDGSESPLNTSSGKRRDDSLLPLTQGLPVTAVIMNRLHRHADLDETVAEEAVDSCILRQFRDRRLARLDGNRLPPTATALDGLRHLVLYNDEIARDAAALTAVRRWLQDGGRLWIMVDRVRQSTVERLLGDAVPYQTVDRVSVTRVQLKTSDQDKWGDDDKPRNYDRPVPLVRVLATGVDVARTVDGWPASFMQRCGKGRILYTTLGMRAWLRPIAKDERQRYKTDVRFFPRDPLEKLTGKLFEYGRRSPLQPEQFDDYVTQQIGYEIVSRNLVIIVLGAFCVALLLTAVWLRRAKRLERMRWIGPGWAVAAATVLTGLGFRSRRSVPETVVVAQLVEAAPDSEEVIVNGKIAVYRQEGSKSTVGMDRGGVLPREFAERPGTARRMLWTDLDRWRWNGLDIPPGVQQTPFHFAANVGRPLRMTGRFGPDGLTGALDTGPFREPADAVVTTATGLAVGVRLHEDGTFVSGPDQSLQPGEFVSGGLLSDEQRRRQEFYRKLWQTKDNVPVVDRPTAFVWTKPIEMGFHVDGEQRRAGSALLSIPLRLTRTPPGTRVRIPAAFLPYRRVVDPEGQTLTGSYNNIQREWVERTGPSRTWLRVQMPAEVLPLVLIRATVTLHFDGPSRRLDVAGAVGKKVVVLATIKKPTGQIRVPITRADVLKLDPRGGLVLGLFVGEGEQPKARKGQANQPGALWRLQYVFIDIEGQTADAMP
jgi:hypothetical protein